MTEYTQVLSWILWNLEESQGSSITVSDVYQDYMDHCARNNIEAATSIAFGRTMYMAFASVRNIGSNGRRIYVNVKLRSRMPDLQYAIPDYCTVKESAGCLNIYVPTEYVRNNEQILWRLQFKNDEVQAYCLETQVCLSTYGISTFAPLTEPYVSGAIAAIQHVRICKGSEWCEELNAVPDVWYRISDENSTMKTVKSPSCGHFVNPLGKAKQCGNCAQFKYHRLLKRKGDDSVGQDGDAKDDEDHSVDSEVTQPDQDFQMPTCGTGWDAFGQSCYQLTTSKKSFNDAINLCQSWDNSHLVALETTEEMDFVESLVTANANTLSCSDASFTMHTSGVQCSGCTGTVYETGRSLSWCVQRTCSENGHNALNYKPSDGLCAWKQCTNGEWKYTSANGVCDVYAIAGYWTSGKMISATWTWTSTSQSITTTRWMTNQPKSAPSACIAMNTVHSNHHWEVLDCSLQQRVICERSVWD